MILMSNLRPAADLEFKRLSPVVQGHPCVVSKKDEEFKT